MLPLHSVGCGVERGIFYTTAFLLSRERQEIAPSERLAFLVLIMISLKIAFII